LKTRITILTLAHVVGTLHIVSVMAAVIQGGLGLGVTRVGPLAGASWFREQSVEETPTEASA
jgi:hypothetical protein